MKENRLSRIWRFFRLEKSTENRDLEQKYNDLLTTFSKIKLRQDRLKDYSEIVSKIEERFKKEKNWENANSIEQFLVSLYSEQELDIELRVKLITAKEKLPDELWKFYRAESEKLTGDTKRSLLSNLNEHLFRIYSTRATARDYIAKTRVRTSLFFILSIIMFFMVDQSALVRTILDINPDTKGDFLITSMAAGWMGTSFSILIGLGNRIQQSLVTDLKIIHRVDYILSRALIGMISGLIIFYSFQSGILTGTFFPAFNETEPLLDNGKMEALLIVWCFASGFSEKLVPDLLSKVKETGKEA